MILGCLHSYLRCRDVHFSTLPGEWISGATCMYVANHLVTKYDRDPLVRLERGYNSLVPFLCGSDWTLVMIVIVLL